jgi:hypothetical protein
MDVLQSKELLADFGRFFKPPSFNLLIFSSAVIP